MSPAVFCIEGGSTIPYSGPDDKSLPTNVQSMNDAERSRWFKIFNSSMASCENRGGADCEAAAFKIANGVAKGKKAGEFEAEVIEHLFNAAEKRKLTDEYLNKVRDLLVAAEIEGDVIADIIKKARASAGGQVAKKKRDEARNSPMMYAEAYAASEGATGRSFIPFTAAEPPSSINVFPKPGTYSHPSYGKIEVTEEGNKLFVDNFNSHIYQEHVPIDAEHETKLSGAVGYIKKLKANKDGSIEAEVEWNERGTKLINEDAYRYISPEWYDDWKDPATAEEHTNVLVGAALTSRPFFKDSALRPLVASEGKLFDVDVDTREVRELSLAADDDDDKDDADWSWSSLREGNEHRKGGSMTVELKDIPKEQLESAEGKSWIRKTAEALGIMKAGEPPDGGDGDPDDKDDDGADGDKGDGNGDDTDAGNGDDTSKPNTATELRRVQSSLKASEDKRIATEKRLVALEEQDRTRRYRDIVLGRDEPSLHQAREAGNTVRAMIGDGDSKVALLRTLADAKGEDSTEFKSFVASEREHANQVHQAGLFSETGVDSRGDPANDSPAREFENRVKAAVEGDTSDKSVADKRAAAVARIASEDPKLYEKYDKAISGRRGSFTGGAGAGT